MRSYRVYCLDGKGNIGLAEWIEANDDSDAIEKARGLKRAALQCEVWQGQRLVASLGSDDLAVCLSQPAFLPPGGSNQTHSTS
jgi:hypothetical protein